MYTVNLGRSTYTLAIRVRTQCSMWRLQGVGGLEGVSGITRLAQLCTYMYRFAHTR
jgi:hypothetical protein